MTSSKLRRRRAFRPPGRCRGSAEGRKQRSGRRSRQGRRWPPGYRRQPPHPGNGVVVDDDDAEGRVAQDDGPGGEGDVHDPEGRAQGHAGDDAGQRDGQKDQQADLVAAEEAVRVIAAATRVPSTRAMDVEIAATLSDRYSGGQMSGRSNQAVANHCVVRAGRQGLERPLFRGEGVEEDQEDRQVEEEKASDGRGTQREGRAVRAHRTPPSGAQGRGRPA